MRVTRGASVPSVRFPRHYGHSNQTAVTKEDSRGLVEGAGREIEEACVTYIQGDDFAQPFTPEESDRSLATVFEPIP